MLWTDKGDLAVEYPVYLQLEQEGVLGLLDFAVWSCDEGINKTVWTQRNKNARVVSVLTGSYLFFQTRRSSGVRDVSGILVTVGATRRNRVEVRRG